MKLFDGILNFIFPPKCIFCGKIIDGGEPGICGGCYPSLEFVKAKDLPHNHSESFSFKQNFSLLFYDDTVSQMIKRFKYDNHPEYAKPIAQLMAKNIDCNVLENIDCIIPVPLHKTRQKQRGFNQAELMSACLSELYNIPVYNNVLKRIKKTAPQYNLSPQQRMGNITGAFAVENAEIVKNKTVMLIDDIFTTGSTMDSCSKALLSHGAAAVYGMTLAITRQTPVN